MSVGALSAGLASYDFSDCDHPAQRGPISIFVMHLIIGTQHAINPSPFQPPVLKNAYIYIVEAD